MKNNNILRVSTILVKSEEKYRVCVADVLFKHKILLSIKC